MKRIGLIVLFLAAVLFLSGCSINAIVENNTNQTLTGCQYNNPSCGVDQDCLNNTCITKQGCAYNNPSCDGNHSCINTSCVLKQGCEYNNPPCNSNYTCINNTCILKAGCSYNNPSCNSNYSCIGNICVLKEGCVYSNPECENGSECINNQCYFPCDPGTIRLKNWCVPPALLNCTNGLCCWMDSCIPQEQVPQQPTTKNETSPVQNQTISSEIELLPQPFESPIRASVAFDCDNNPYTLYKSSSYECFDLSDLEILNKLDNIHAERIVFYGAYSAFDCPNSKAIADYNITNCYYVAWFFDRVEHSLIADFLGVSPKLSFYNPTQNPYDIVYVTAANNLDDVHSFCGMNFADACAGGWKIIQQASGIDTSGKEKTFGMSIPATGDSYFYTIKYPINCNVGEFHEHTHIFDRLLLSLHDQWFEEILARTIHDSFDSELCNFEIKNAYLYSNGQIKEYLTDVDRREINSERPFENFAVSYVGNDSCKQAILMQLNRDAVKYGKSYIRSLYSEFRIEPLGSTSEISTALIKASPDPESARQLLTSNGCKPD